MEDRLPMQQNVLELALGVSPCSRVVYVVRDPMVASHARALLQEEGRAVVVHADTRDPDATLDEPRLREAVDLDKPVAVLLMCAALDMVGEDDAAQRLVTGLRDRIAPGSYIAISHAISDVRPDMTGELASIYRHVIQADSWPANARTRAEVERFFDGLELVEPGLVFITEWRPDSGIVIEKPQTLWQVAGVGRKP